jgi:chromosomal replication initiation ATPase DnaA
MKTTDEILIQLCDLGLDGVACVIAQRHALTLPEMFSRDKHEPLPQARAEFYAYMKFVRGWSYPKIGQLVGRDHTTIMNQARMAMVREVAADQVAAGGRVRVA